MQNKNTPQPLNNVTIKTPPSVLLRSEVNFQRRIQIFHRPSSSSFPPKAAEIRRPSSDFATTLSPTMKGSCTLLASVLAASTMAFSSSSSSSSTGDRDLALYPPSQQGFVSESGANRGCGSDSSSEKEKFAPRFDGLRFIETLVTAHR